MNNEASARNCAREGGDAYEAALAYAKEKHAGQLRIGGEAYITHPVAVAGIVRAWGYGMEYQLAALFHDLLEDTDAASAEIAALGGKNVLRAVERLTKRKGYEMEAYVAAIRADPIARVVKAADRLHNLRCAVCADEAFRRRYIRETREWYMDFSPEIPVALRRLEETLEEAQTEI